jgi:hypothetical protein
MSAEELKAYQTEVQAVKEWWKVSTHPHLPAPPPHPIFMTPQKKLTRPDLHLAPPVLPCQTNLHR